jgi:uncharacterized membrane protein YfcA
MKNKIGDRDIIISILIMGFILAVWGFLVSGSIYQSILTFAFFGAFLAFSVLLLNWGSVDENEDYPIIEKLEKNQYIWGR